MPRREIREFTFKDWKSRPIPTLQGTGILTEELEESIMQMQTFLTMRHVAPFREEATELLANLNDAADTLEQWVKVQLMWCSLESVFTGLYPVWKYCLHAIDAVGRRLREPPRHRRDVIDAAGGREGRVDGVEGRQRVRSSRHARSAPRPSERPKLGHDVPSIQSTVSRELKQR